VATGSNLALAAAIPLTPFFLSSLGPSIQGIVGLKGGAKKEGPFSPSMVSMCNLF